MNPTFTIDRARRTLAVRTTVGILLALAGAMLIALTLSATAQAGSRDANRDGLPDRWERKHKLSLKVNQARKDQDRDGVANVCELQARTNPRRKDSDRDGRRDGAEDHDRDGVSNGAESRGRSHCGNRDSDDDGTRDDDEGAGKIVSFENGVLTIETFGGETISGTVDASTKIECGCDDNDDDDRAPAPAPAPTTTATTSHDGPGDDGPGDDRDDDGPGDDDADDDDGPHRENGSSKSDDSSDDDHCGVEALVAGATVHEATLIDGLFVKIELAG